MVQPDVFWISEANDHCVLVDGKYWRGAPDLTAEVLSPGTAKLDVGDKFDLYEQYGVREYWLVDAQALFVQVFQRQNDHFARQGVFDKSGSFASVALGGLTVPVDKLLE